jgi:hypothetical protein
MVGAAGLAAVFACGCVERWIQVRSEPPGAQVYLDGEGAGPTPLRIAFDHYGGHEILIRKPGYRSVSETVRVRAPWYQYVPVDLVAEVIWPGTITDEHTFDYRLEPLPEADAEGETIAEKAGRLRERLSPPPP